MPPPSEQIQAEAVAWLIRLQRDQRGAGDNAAFRAWVAADPDHAVAFEAVSENWDITGGLPRDLRGAVLAPSTSNRANRRKVMAGGVAMLAGAGALAFWRSARTFQTEVGEQKHIALDDGTRIFLDTDTRLDVGFGETQRTTYLHYGQVNFQVAPDPIRPFVVNAAKAKVIAAPSNIDVRVDGQQLSVVLVKGSADIIRAPAPAEQLQAGERLVIGPQGSSRRDRPVLASLVAWQTGQAIFEDGRLGDAAAEMNRYSNVKLAIPESDARDFKVSGVYSVGDNIAFANSVALLLPVRLVQTDGNIEIVVDKARQARG